MSAILQPTADFAYPSINMTAEKLVAQTDYLRGRVADIMGAKAVPLDIEDRRAHNLEIAGLLPASAPSCSTA